MMSPDSPEMTPGLPFVPVGTQRPDGWLRDTLRKMLHAAWRRLPALLPALLFLPLVLAPPLNHDVAAVLQFSQRWLGGEHLYSDLIDVNPPLIYVLNLLPAGIAAISPLGATQALQLCLLVYGAACWWLALRVRDRAAEHVMLRAILDVLPLLFLLGAGYDFGQREHLMTVAALPYLLSATRRAQGEQPRHGLAVGLIAGVGFALKPYFLGIPFLVELAVLLSRGRLLSPRNPAFRDKVPWTMAGVWVAYAVSLPVVFPNYLNVVLPLVWDFYLDLGDLSPWQELLVPRMATALLLLLPLLWLALRPRASELPLTRHGRSYRPTLARLLALAACGAVASAVVQHKGWSYHIVPIELFAGALGAVLAANWLDGLRITWPAATPQHVAAVLGSLIALYSVSNGEAPWKQLDYADSDVAGLASLLRREAAGERVLVLSPGISPIYPAMNYAGATQTLRTMNVWLLQGAYETCLPDGRRYREMWEMGRPEFFVFRTVAEDFARAPPAAVVVDTDPGIPWCGGQFDFIAYFSRHPLFAEVWSHYQLAQEWRRYRIYTRKD